MTTKENKATSRRNWIKNIAIIFLVIMLVLTLFSNTIMNYTLPQVSAQYVNSGSITTKVKGSGVVEAKESYEVTADRSFTVTDVGIKVGNAVKKGDVMFLLDENASDEMIKLLTELTELKKQQVEALAELSPDFTKLSTAVTRKESDLATLKAQRDKISTSAEKLAEAKELERETKKVSENIKKELDKLNIKIGKLEALDGIDEVVSDSAVAALAEAESLHKQMVEKLARAEKAAESATTSREAAEILKSDADATLKDYTDKKGDSTVTDNEILTMTRAIEDLKTSYSTMLLDFDHAIVMAESKMNALLKPYTDAVNLASAKYWEYMNGGSYDDYLAAEQAIAAPKAAYEEGLKIYDKTVLDENRKLDAKKLEIERAEEDYDLKMAIYNDTELKRLKEIVIKATDNVKTATKTETTAKKEIETVKKEVETAKKAVDIAKLGTQAGTHIELRAEYSQMELDYEVAQDEYTKASEAVKELNAGGSTADLEASIKTAERDLEDARKELSTAQSTAAKGQETAKLKLSVIETGIAEKQKLIDGIKNSNDIGKFLSPVDGVVTEIKFSPGQKVTLNDAVAKIQLVDKGYMVQFTLNNDQAKRIRAGDIANVQNYWGPSINAIVDSIVTDKNNPSSSKLVTINVTGEISIGTNLSFSIGEKSQNYDMIIPISALKEDNKGKFLYIVTVKSTPLGNRYTAKRADIQVLAQDETSVAISGLNYGDFIIMTASVPVTAGMQVRMVES